MAAPSGILRVHQDQPTITFQAEGRAIAQHGQLLRQQAEQALAAGITAVRVDLRQCTYMDSTFLGTLLYLKRLTDRHAQATFALVSPSPQCRDLLHQTCLDRVYPIVDEDALPEDGWQVLCADDLDALRFRCTVVEAHQELAGLPGPAGAKFQAVARFLSEQKPEAEARHPG